MNRNEYTHKLEGSFDNWLLYVEYNQIMSYNEAVVTWNNCHLRGKYVICEARENNSTRLFIRDVSDIHTDTILRKNGWWNIFTVTKNPVSKGLWLAEVDKYYLDKNGFINLRVETIIPMDDIKYYKLFSLDTDGTWNSIAWWLMMVCSNTFLPEYKFDHYQRHNHKPNIDALINHFPELEGKCTEEIGKIMLNKYLRNETILEEIEECLNAPSEREVLIKRIQRAVASGKVEKEFGEMYPNFAKKITNNALDGDFVIYEKIDNYLTRNICIYNDLVREGKIEGDIIIDCETPKPLDAIESVLVYRKVLKEAEKLAKKEKRKMVNNKES